MDQEISSLVAAVGRCGDETIRETIWRLEKLLHSMAISPQTCARGHINVCRGDIVRCYSCFSPVANDSIDY